MAAALLVSCGGGGDGGPWPPGGTVFPDEIVSLDVGSPGHVLTRTALHVPGGGTMSLPAAEAGRRLSAAWADGKGESWVGYEHGAVYRSGDDGRSWTRSVEGYLVPDLVVLDLSLRRPVPRRFVRARDGTLYLATAGRGVLRWDPGTASWVDASFRLDLDGNVHPLALSLGRLGQGVAAGFVSPKGIVPPQLAALFGALVRRIDGPGAFAAQIPFDEDGPRIVVDVAERGGRLVAATIGHGVLEHDGAAWRPLGPDAPPADLFAVDVNAVDEIAAITLSGDVWRRRVSGAWERVRCGGDGRAGSDVRWDGADLVAAAGRELLRFRPQATACAPRGGAHVLLALSQHTNLYHSYRGDTNDEDGYGKDIRILRSTLAMLQRHPAFRNDWDVENAFSLDGWLLTEAPDVREGIRRRVVEGSDGIRLMSHNNGMMAVETEEEIGRSLDGARASFGVFVLGLGVPGVRPRENTYTPAHPRLHVRHGIGWMTLFYSATSFTGFRDEVALSLRSAHGVLSLGSDLHAETMLLVPVYHHADAMEHGGLANWARQLHESLDGTAVLAIHFDADSETWLGFEEELADVEAMGAAWVEPVRLQDVVARVAPVEHVVVRRDLADGAFDGFSSWTEKPVNHRFFTRIVRSRLDAARARRLARSGDVEAPLERSAAARHLALSTTHFGLANPRLHPQREARGDAYTIEAEAEARRALTLAAGEAGLAPGTVHNLSGAAATFLQPVATGLGSGGPDAAIRTLRSPDGSRRWLVGTLPAGGSAALSPGDATMGPASTPEPGWGPPMTGVEVLGPRLAFEGRTVGASVVDRRAVSGGGAEVLTVTGAWDAGTGGSVRYDWIRFAEDAGAFWVEVNARFPRVPPEDLPWWDDAIPLALRLPAAEEWSVTRVLATGDVATYAVRGPRDALNNHAADGWVVVRGGGESLGVSTFAPLRSAPAFLPLRMAPGPRGTTSAVLAPFGALFGELPDHGSRRLLGTGVAEDATRLTAPQLKPTAPAWDGEATSFLLRLQPGASADVDRARLDGARDGVLLVGADGAPAPWPGGGAGD